MEPLEGQPAPPSPETDSAPGEPAPSAPAKAEGFKELARSLIVVLAAGTLIFYAWDYNPRAQTSQALSLSPFIQDLQESANESGMAGLFRAIPAGLGVGVMAYSPALRQKLEQFPTYKNLDPDDEKRIRKFNAEIRKSITDWIPLQNISAAWNSWNSGNV